MENFIKIKTLMIAFLCIISFNNTLSGKNESLLAAPNWTVNAPSYQYNMNLTAQSFQNGTPFQGEVNDLLAAFDANDNCVGLVNITNITGSSIGYLTLYSNNTSGDLYTLKYYDASADMIFDIQQTMNFLANDILGMIASPIQLDLIVQTTVNSPTNLQVNSFSSPGLYNALSWNDNSNNEAGFIIYRADSLNGTYIPVGFVGANETNYYDGTQITRLLKILLFFGKTTPYF